MRVLRFTVFLLLAGVCGARAGAPWTATLYAGPATASSSSQIFLHGNYTPDAVMVGLAVDYPLFDLGSGFTLDGEGQATRFAGKRNYTTLNLGMGLRFSDFPWEAPTSVALLTGPSWADDPPLISTGSFHGMPIQPARKKFLEYVGAEFAVSISDDPAWSGVLRFYHRSGAFGLYAPNADEGSMLGIGVRRQF